MQNKKETLQPDSFYHIYSRANGNEKLFISDPNFRFFLEKYKLYFHPIVYTYCYCLMPNHFHFLVQIKNENEVMEHFRKEHPNLQGFENLEGLISKQFSRFLNSYAKAFNKQQGRKGSLFMHTFKRKRIVSRQYLLKLIHYIHYNPIQAGLCLQMTEWNYSSYEGLLSKSSTLLQRDKVIEWFDDNENFIFIHQQIPKELSIVFD